MRSPKASLLLVALSLSGMTACSSGTEPIDPTITPSAIDVWAGGTITVHSRLFQGRDTLPVVLLGGDTIPTTVADTFTIRVTIPDTLAGHVDPSIRLAGGAAYPLALLVHGFVAYRPGPNLAGLPQHAMDGSILANGDSSIVRVLPWAGTAEVVVPGSAHNPLCTLSPGVSLESGTYLASQGTGSPGCKFHAWTGSPVADTDSTQYGFAWSAAYLGNHRWLVNTKSWTYAVSNGTTVMTLWGLSQPDEFIVDPQRRVIVPSFAHDVYGMPVFIAATGDTAYTLPRGDIWGAAFSPGGDTLFAVLRDTASGSPARLAVINPVNGAILHADTQAADGGNLLVDPAKPYLYYAGVERIDAQGNAAAYVRIVDRVTLKTLAHLRAPARAPQPYWTDCTAASIGPDRHLYVVTLTAFYAPAAASRIYEFELP